MHLKQILLIFVIALALPALACGLSQDVAMSDLPVYPDATVLQPGDNPVADTLANNIELNAQLSVGGSVEQVAHQMPAGTTWEQAKAYYGGQLEDDGWKSGLDVPFGDLVGDALDAVNQAVEQTQTAIWSKGDQTLTLIWNEDPLNTEQPILILSLATN